MNIDLTKQYTTRSGLPVKLYDIVTDTNQTYPVIGAVLHRNNEWESCNWSLKGSSNKQFSYNDELDIIVKPIHNFTKDQLVLVWDTDSTQKRVRVYSHFNYEENCHEVFYDGLSSISTNNTITFGHCEPYLPTHESKPLEEGELVVVWDNSDEEYINPANKYAIRRFHHEVRLGKYSVTNQEGEFDDEPNYWDNCVRLSEFKLD